MDDFAENSIKQQRAVFQIVRAHTSYCFLS